MSGRAQRDRLLARLKQGPLDTIEAREALNILMPAARVKELREAGCEIVTERETINGHRGVARYVLLQLPSDLGSA